MVTRMDALFLVDREARQQQMSVEERLALRREYASRIVGCRDSRRMREANEDHAAEEHAGASCDPTY